MTPASSIADEAPADRSEERAQMVKEQIEDRGVKNARVLEAMRSVPREWFVPEKFAPKAYRDHPLDIGHGQTISQPYIVAAMTELLDPQPDQTVLEVGTGSGYQAAVLAKLVREVDTIEIVAELAERAKKTLAAHGFSNVHVFSGDGYRGRPDLAPFDGIIVTAAPDSVPKPLLEQLKIGGRLVIPVGRQHGHQMLKVLERTKDGIKTREIFEVRFVPMTGEAEKKAN
jgi:protein-L-isoaspartate(D-aspartate) O-methyltransferase